MRKKEEYRTQGNDTKGTGEKTSEMDKVQHSVDNRQRTWVRGTWNKK